jgi:hypothetical protein
VTDTDTDVVDLLAGLRNGAWLHAQDFPPLTYAVPGVFPEGFTLLVSPPKAGKSWLVLGTALGVAAGGVALGRLHVQHRPVLYLALEDGHRRLQDRCRVLLGEHEPIPPAFEYLTKVAAGRVLETVETWLDQHGEAAPLVIVDTLGKIMPPAMIGESSYMRDYRVGGALKRIVDAHPGTSLVIVHHTRKAVSDDFIDSVSGTHGLAGAADTIVVLARARNETDAVLKVTGRDVAEGEYALTLTRGGVWQLSGATLAAAAAEATRRRQTADLGDQSADIVSFVHAHPEGVRAKDVEGKFGDGTRRYLSRLHESGRIVRMAHGRYGPPPSTPVPSVPVSHSDDGNRLEWDNGTGGTPLLRGERCDQCGDHVERTVTHHATGEHWCPRCCQDAAG